MPQPPEPGKKPSEKLPINEQIADLVVALLRPGGITAGGVGAFWFLLRESDIPKALASVAIGVGLSWGAKLLKPIHEGTQKRLENTGKALDQVIERNTEQVFAKLTSAEDRYFTCQTAECERCNTEGLAKISGIFTPMLEQVFVPLELDRSACLPGFSALAEKMDIAQLARQIFTHIDIWNLLTYEKQDGIYRQIAILAWGGYGKTTLLRHIAYTLGKNQQPASVRRFIPVLLLLRKHRDLLTQKNPPNLADLMTHHHIPDLPGAEGLRLPTDWAQTILKQGKALVMLDGFDEVPRSQRPLIARWLNQQMRAYPQSIFILTSRPKAYTEQPAADRLDFHTLLWVRNFNLQQRKDFVHKWYWCQEYYHHGKTDSPYVQKIASEAAIDLLTQIEQRQELADLTRNPLLLNMIAQFHRRYPSAALPKRRVELYQEMCVLQLQDRPGARKLETSLVDCDAQTILQMLALEMMQRKEERIDQKTLLEWLTHYLQVQEESIAASEFLMQVEQISELLVQREPEEFEFSHLSFQEYLAAKEVARLPQEELLYDHLGEDWWKQTILLYAALTKKPSSLIRAAIKGKATDLAYACWQETRRRIDDDLKQELEELQALQEAEQTLQTSRYAKLEEYLKNGQWKEADYETYRLMITNPAVGKEEGQWFDAKDLKTFPCEDLRTLDQLWVKYSNGKWGFSVQKRIWQDCGSPMEYNDQWEQFCDRVGWRKDGAWLNNYYDLTFNLNLSSPGEFPVGFSLGEELTWGLLGGLFSRRETCEL